jgi:small subunit ribosomal protein S20
MIDKAVKRGAMHRNTGARKKSRAARVAASAGAAAGSSPSD